MTPEEMRRATGPGRRWLLVWMGAHAPPDVEHLCGILYAPDGTYVSECRRLAFEPPAAPGIEVAKCARCRVAWVGK